MLYTHNNIRNHSMFSKRGSDGHFRRFTQNGSHHLKLSNSKTFLDVCPTDRSQSQANETSNNFLGNSQDNIESPRISQFHIKTYIRFKPIKSPLFFQHKSENSTQSSSMRKIAVIDKKKILCEDNFFSYDHVFEQFSSQKDIYNCVCKQMVEHFTRGFNSTIFAYGQTGSGKTYTMFGDIQGQDDKNKGIVPEVIKDIFAAISTNNMQDNKQKNQIIMSCSMLQIYKETMIDLLSTEKSDLKIKQHQIFNVANLHIKQVNNENEMYQVLKVGNYSKKIRQTNMNEASSRSHVIFTIYLEVKKQNQRRLSKFNLVDLAGSQKVSKSKVEGEGLEQAKKINLSLSCLGNTINALLKGNDHIPYRQSKLTRLLYESLGGNSLTRLIVTCSSEDSEIEETLSSLKFASRAKNLKTNPLINTLRKSQKSVSRIAYENLKTNLHKAQHKLSLIHTSTEEFKMNLKINKKIHHKQDKQNQSFLSNNHSNQTCQFNGKYQSLSSYDKAIEEYLGRIQAILVGLEKDKDLDGIQRIKQNDYIQTETILNPFCIITENNDQKYLNQHQKIENKPKIVSEQNKSIPILTQMNSSKKQNQKYWQIIKQQQKQIELLKKKLNKQQQITVLSYKTQQMHKNHFISSQISKLGQNQRINSVQQSNSKYKQTYQNCSNLSSQTKINLKKQNITKKLSNIKLQTNKCLPIREICLNSPTYKTSDFSKKQFQINSISISHKKSNQNIFNQDIQSLCEFNQVEAADKQTKLSDTLEQIIKRLQHRNEYEKFQKRILLRQIQQLCQYQYSSNIVQSEITHQQIDKQINGKTKILNQQTNQLIILQAKYIEQLENVFSVLKQKNCIIKENLYENIQSQTKHQINAIKFR